MTKVPTDFFYDIADKLFSLVSYRKITTKRYTFQVRKCLPQDVTIVISFLTIQKLLKYTFIEQLFALIKVLNQTNLYNFCVPLKSFAVINNLRQKLRIN